MRKHYCSSSYSSSTMHVKMGQHPVVEQHKLTAEQQQQQQQEITSAGKGGKQW